MTRKLILLFGPLVILTLVSCAPAVPYNQMPGAPGDLYSNANGNRMTADALLREAQWQEQALTATAGAPIVRITETAAALSVQATQAQGTSVAAAQTQVGAMTATAVWWTPTPNFDSTSTVAVLNAQNTAIANEAIRNNLQLEQERITNEFYAILPGLTWALCAGLLVIGVLWMIRRTRYQAAQVDARGNVLPLLDIVEGSYTDIDNAPNFKGSMKNDWMVKLLAHWFEKRTGAKLLLPEVTAQRQDAVKERDQMVDLATRGLPGPVSDGKERQKLAGQAAVKQIMAPKPEQRYTIFDESKMDLTPINGVVIEHLDRDWQEAQA